MESRVSRVVFVVTTGDGSLDLYAQKLAEQLDVPTLETDAYGRIAGLFNVPALSARSARGFAADVRFLRLLRSAKRPVHLPNQHLARYGNFLSIPYVVTVHDLVRYLDLTRGARLIHEPNGRDRVSLRLDYRGIRRATAVIAVSEATKRDLVRYLDLPPDRIFVVHEGIDHGVFRPLGRRLVEWPYVLFVGSEHPRKNLAVLLCAFAALKRDRRFRDLKLVKVGAPGGGEAPFRQATRKVVAELGLREDVVFTGRLRDVELAAWYSGASCFALPSLYEGFGFPPLEAMACGCPVVVSTATSLPEVTGDAAIHVDPHDVDALTTALRAVLTDDRLAGDLRVRGLAHARRFSWERCARETAAVYRVLEPATDDRGGIHHPRRAASPPAPAAALADAAPQVPPSGRLGDRGGR